jgi:hypothetical protein
MAKGELDIDPNNLKFEFEGEWSRFQISRVRKFLSLWLRKRLNELHLSMESVAPVELGKAQGAVHEIRRMISLVERPFAVDALREVITYLESK